LEKAKAGYIEGIVSIAVNTALFALKLWAGIVTSSIALTADAYHTLSDSVSSAVVVLAVKLSGRKADDAHPFGHGRWEQIASLFIAFMLGIIAFEFLKNSFFQFQKKESVEYGTLAVIVTVVSIVVKELLAQTAFYIGKKTDSASVKADGWHHRTDMLSSAAVLLGIFFAKLAQARGANIFWWIDSALGAVISLMLFYAAFGIIKESVDTLLGEEPKRELVDEITRTVKTVYSSDLRLHHFHIHNYVLHKELTLHACLNGNLTIEQGHNVATDIEFIIKEKFGITATVHIEPLGHDFF
jgi:cation diffusion facilitator family transporter